MVVAAGSAQPNAAFDGLWLTSIEKEDWWHCPRTHELARADTNSLIERLRATMPVWTKDGDRFAFATSTRGSDEEPVAHKLRLGNTAKAKTLLNKETTWLDKNRKAVKSWWWILRVGTTITRGEAERLVNDKAGKPEK